MTKLNETINPNNFQIIPITSEMKAKYPALKKYKELIVSGKGITWNEANKYAKEIKAVLPSIKEAEDIIDLVKDSHYDKYFDLWTRKTVTYYNNVAYFYNTRKDFFMEDKNDFTSFCFCLR